MEITEEKLKLIIKNIASDNDGILFLDHLLDKTEPFSRGILCDTKRDYYNKGKRDIGLYILDLLSQYAPQEYIEILIKRRNNS